MAAKRLVIVPGLYPVLAAKAAAITANRYAHALRRLGLAVEIVGVDPQTPSDTWRTAVDPDGLTVTRVGPGAISPTRRLVWQALESRGPFDGVLALSLGQVGQPAVMCARQWGVPAVVHALGADLLIDLFDPHFAAFVSWTLRQASRVTAATREMAALAAGFAPGGRVDHWPESVDASRFQRQPIVPGGVGSDFPAAGLRLGTLGAPQEGTGLADVLTAFGLVRRERPDAQLVLVGTAANLQANDMMEAWQQRDPESAGRMVWIPEPDPAERATYFNLLDQLWVPWRRDGFGQGLLQAMACEVPIIATAVGNQAELLRDGDNALMVPLRRPDVLAAAALRLGADPAWARVMGAAARRSLPEQVRPEAEAARLADVCQEFGLIP